MPDIYFDNKVSYGESLRIIDVGQIDLELRTGKQAHLVEIGCGVVKMKV